ncbi:MAG: hypothetical protein JWQ62_2434, partial [Lacunisphaera sp.]|nr:hypothetical protein [Lacunisphaera sp.]MDB6115489.1 hypothetical protein [Lacunisphaera sp.]
TLFPGKYLPDRVKFACRTLSYWEDE